MLFAMSITKWILSASLIALPAISPAQTCLKGLPQSLRATLEQDEWTIVEPHDLPQADLDIWNDTHLGECPGVAVGAPAAKAKPYFIVALIQRDGPHDFLEKVLLITRAQNHSVVKVVIPETTVVTPHVVWLQKTHYLSIDPVPARDSFVFEKLAGPASQPIVQGSHVRSFFPQN
jgi:hypothetical protein